MAKNNHFDELDRLLKGQAGAERLKGGDAEAARVWDYARGMAAVENVIAVVSDLATGTSRIFSGAFAEVVGLEGYQGEDSIWERRLLRLLEPGEVEAKMMSELRFFHYVRRGGRSRGRYFLMSKLRMRLGDGRVEDVLHRMYYVYDADGQTVRFAICLYGPLTVSFQGRSVAVDSLTGLSEALDSGAGIEILSRRELQVLALIDAGFKSREIAERLSISLHTVSRHRQEILAKLRVRNSPEACRLARSLGLI